MMQLGLVKAASSEYYLVLLRNMGQKRQQQQGIQHNKSMQMGRQDR
jgi:hypothetical protein